MLENCEGLQFSLRARSLSKIFLSYNSKPHRFGYGQRPNALPDKEQLKQSWWDRHDELTRSQHLTYE